MAVKTKGKGTVYIRQMGSSNDGSCYDALTGMIEVSGGRVAVTLAEPTDEYPYNGTYGVGKRFDFPAGWCAIRWHTGESGS